MRGNRKTGDGRREARSFPSRGRLPPSAFRLPGFSLLELLTVLLIIGIVATMAVLSVSTADSERLLEKEARRLAALVNLNCEESVLRSETLAVTFGPGGTSYGFLRRSGEQWLQRTGETWRPRVLAEGFRAELEVEGRPVVLDEATAGRPHLVCLASGEILPFRVRLTAPDAEAGFRVTGEWDGDVAVERIHVST